MLRVYLDTSIYNRPFDDQNQPKIVLETQAVNFILELVETQQIELVKSAILEYENNNNPHSRNRDAMNKYLQMAIIEQKITENIRERAKNLEEQGIKSIDALHVACAEASNSNYFITCDKRLINRCKGLPVKTINPVDFILEIEDENQSNE